MLGACWWFYYSDVCDRVAPIQGKILWLEKVVCSMIVAYMNAVQEVKEIYYVVIFVRESIEA